MNKFLGILFFYSLAFYDKERNMKKSWRERCEYLQEKSGRYLGLTISEAQWELLKIYLKDFPEPMKEEYLTASDINEIIEYFDKVFHMENINYELRMYGVEYEQEMEIIDGVFNDITNFIEVICTSNGVHIGIGNWFSKCDIQRPLIERTINLIELISD